MGSDGLRLNDVYNTGRQGLPADVDTALCAAQAIPATELSGKAIHVSDSACFQAFARLPGQVFPKKSVLKTPLAAFSLLRGEDQTLFVAGCPTRKGGTGK
jgi:IS5 family transposase